MITNYLPYIFGSISFFIGLYLFLLSFRLYKPKHKTEEQKARFENWLVKFGTLLKICSVVMIMSGAYDLIKRDPNRYRVDSQNKNSEWTTEDKEEMVNGCMKSSGQTAIEHPALTKDYCDCSIDKIMAVLPKEKYLEISTESREEQAKKILPISQDCLNEFKERLDSLNQQTK